MEIRTRRDVTVRGLLLVGAISASTLSFSINAGPVPTKCPNLDAPRSDQFHGNPIKNDLSLFMAGNQWVVFKEVLDTYFTQRGGEIEVYTELVPPGFERDQILAGCMTFGAESVHNFNPMEITTQADVFASTNATLVDDLGGNHGLMYKAKPYVKNKLNLLVKDGDPAGIDSFSNDTFGTVMMLLDAGIRVSQVDHINEGIHGAINNMYRQMDINIRKSGTATEKAALSARLNALATPEVGSPAATRDDAAHNADTLKNVHDLSKNSACNYADNLAGAGVDVNGDGVADDVNGDNVANAADAGTLRFCEFAVLNKANTHETRVHHVETPALVRAGINGTFQGTQGVDTGPLWVSEVQFAINDIADVHGLGIEPASNFTATYFVGIVDGTITSNHKIEAVDFINFLRSETAQEIYARGGFTRLTPAELADESKTRYYNGVSPAFAPGSW